MTLWVPLVALLSHGVLFTDEALREDERLFVVVLGKVYDVSASPSFYGAGAPYEGFANGDASRAFLTADFAADGTSDVSGLTPRECAGLESWQRLYDDKYEHVGWHVGRFYDDAGEPTVAYAAWRACADDDT